VLVMIHGGNEYQRQPTRRVQAMVEVARAAGAAAILNHHPHVVGGFQWQGGTLVADSLGNFLFDQTLWPTFESYLLELHLRRGVVVRALAEPLILHRYRPYALVGGLADFVARGAAGRGPAAAFVESGTVEVDGGRLRRRRTWPLQLRGQPQQGSVFHTSPGVWLERAGGAGQLEGGRDLLWVGDFEDGAVGVEPGAGMLWGLSPPDKALHPQAAATGAWGVRLERSPANRQAVMLSPVHRIPVQPGQRLTLLGWMRGPTTARARLLVGWHAARRGGSQARIERPISLAGPGRWLPVRWDLTVPPYAVALGLYVVLDPPAWGRSHLDVDGLRLILWEPANGSGGPLLDWYRLKGPAALRVIGEVGPGAEALLAPPAQRLVRAWGAP
jgi:poly-gamma-glutamate synthesis protein (capsule biosynthesis protein)